MTPPRWIQRLADRLRPTARCVCPRPFFAYTAERRIVCRLCGRKP